MRVSDAGDVDFLLRRDDHAHTGAVLAFIANHLTHEDEKVELGKIFKSIDLDGDGNLTKEEIL